VLTHALCIALTLPVVFAAAPPQQPTSQPQQAASPASEDLWAAARTGDTAGVTRALEKGADVNAKTRYGATALTFAADKGHLAVAKFLVEKGADLDVQDTFYRARPVDMAMQNRHVEVVKFLLEKGAQGAGSVLAGAVQMGNVELVKIALASSEITRQNLTGPIAIAKKTGNTAILEQLNAKLESMPAAAAPTITIDRATLEKYAGTYRNQAQGFTLTATLNESQLFVSTPGGQPLTLIPTSQTAFRAAEVDGITIAFTGRGGMIEQMQLTQNNTTQTLERLSAEAAAAATAPPAPASTPAATKPDPDQLKPAPRAAAKPWPGFRGDNASGNADGQGAVVEWDIDTNQNVKWKTPIPGISTASPIIWSDRIYVVSAVSSAGDKTFRTGLYGDVKPVEDVSEHTWKVFALDKASGKILWEQTAFTGVPKVKRHTKSSQSNSSPVTDGKRVVAVFGSIGLLAAWDVNGKPLWKQDIGVLNSGWFFDPEYQWGHSSSPIIYKNTVIVQADQQKGSFIAAYDLSTGKQVWKTDRPDEIPTWGTPAIFSAEGRDQIVTNGTKIRGYDAATGKLLWTLGPNSEVTVGTPVVGEGLVFITGGYPPVRPIYAVKPGASGEISITKEQATHDAVAWSNDREGTYIPSPIFYQGILYLFGNNGVLTAYDAKTGERLYRARVGGGGSFAASPIAADGRLYFANEDGEVIVARAGKTYQELAKNEMKEVIMSTPAISDGVVVIRTLGHVYGIGEK
jgi:hypothetical protein